MFTCNENDRKQQYSTWNSITWLTIVQPYLRSDFEWLIKWEIFAKLGFAMGYSVI